MATDPEDRTHRILTLAGHVDHGKSTLVGRLTGMPTDRLHEEQRRGLTIDLGFLWTTLRDRSARSEPVDVAFIDVPGHERFVTTMLAGTGCSTLALVVVAADEGIRAQTVEHCEILDLLGVPAAAVAITKSGKVDAARVADVATDVAALLSGTSLEGAPVVAVDALSGEGVEALAATLRDALRVEQDDRGEHAVRLWIDRAFVVQGSGTVVTGTLTEGTLAVGDRALILPSGDAARVRGLQRLGRPVQRTGPGMRVAVNLAGVHHDRIRRGDVLSVGSTVAPVSEFDLVVRVPAGRRLERRGAWRAHVGTAGVACQVRPTLGAIDGPDVGVVRVVLGTPLPLRLGDRVLLRDEGRRRSVAGGIVADIDAQRPQGRADRVRRVTGARAVAERLAGGDEAAVLAALLELSDGMRDEASLRAALGRSVLPAVGVSLGPLRVTDALVAQWGSGVDGALDAVMDRTGLLARMAELGVPEGAREALIERSIRRGNLSDVGGRFARPDDIDDAQAGQDRRRADVLARLREAAFSPPDFGTIAREVGMDHLERQRMLASDAVVRADGIVFAADAVRRAVEELEALEVANGPFTAAEARVRLGTTRRHVIPLLEHLARTGVTVFEDGRHRLRRVSR